MRLNGVVREPAGPPPPHCVVRRPRRICYWMARDL